MNLKQIFILASTVMVCACSSNDSIFPHENLSLSESSIVLANPISLVVDAANDQLIVVNSNIDYYFEKGAIYTFDVDASNPAAPQLTATSARLIPNFAGDALLSGGILYVPYREAETTTTDKIESYTVGAASITDNQQGVVGENPFGIGLSGGTLYVVNDETISVLNTSLTNLDEVDLTIAEDAGIVRTKSKNAESLVVDAINGRLYVSNRDGKIFVVDTSTNEITHVINGPLNSRGMVSDGSRIYVINGDSPALWVLDPSLLPAATSSIQEVDDSVLTLAQIDLGLNPNGITYDANLGRIYVTNLGENTLSVIDTTTLVEIARVSFDKDDTGYSFDGKQPFAVTTGTFDGVPLVFVGDIDGGVIFVINANTLKVVEVFPN